MFKFEPLERCLYSGVSSAMIADGSVRNEFLMRFGEPSLDDRVSVVLTDRNIQFFYYDVPKNHNILENARDHDHLKEIGSISLTSPKETGNDILNFPQNGFFPKNVDKGSIKKLNVGFRNIFSHFPFMENYSEDSDEEQIFRSFVKCCLLAFVFELEDREEDFANSPLYDEVRKSLRKSDVYNLLSAKISYTLYVNDEGSNYNRDEYSYKTRKFADRLMDKNINKVIAPYNYCPKGKIDDTKEAITRQSWFYNPEEELERILDKNRRQASVKNGNSALGEVTLDPQLELKIQNFLYTKHAIFSAMTRDSGKGWFVAGQNLMAITWICIAWACFTPDLTEIKDLGLFVGYFAAIAPVCWLFFVLFSGCSNNPLKKSSSNLLQPFLPRILVAIAAAWLGVGIAEDTVKSMLWANRTTLVVAVGVVLLLIFIILMGEIKQHSPYYKWFSKNVIIRTLFILNHSIFFAFICGIVMQIVFYNNLVKTSEVLPNVVYNDYFDKANYYCQNLETLNESLRQFELVYLTTRKVGNIAINNSLKDSVNKITASFRSEASYGENLSEEDYNRYVNIINQSIKEIISLDTSLNVKPFLKRKMSLCNLDRCMPTIGRTPICQQKNNLSLYYMLDTIGVFNNDKKNDIIVNKENRKMISYNTIRLQGEIVNVKRAISTFNNYDTLINWATVNQENSVNTGSAYLDKLTKNAQKDYKCSLTIPVCDKNKPARFFPILLIFHTLIVLVLAFVTQLLISDKSVTEPL